MRLCIRRHLHILCFVAIILGATTGCGPHWVAPEVLDQGNIPTRSDPPEYRIQSGDQLEIKFFYNPELNETTLVRPDGKISLQLVDEVQASGTTPAELDTLLTELYSRELKKPVITIIVRDFAGMQVYVGGEVNAPGLVNITAGMTALQAVISARGFTEGAKPDAVIVIRKGPDNRPVPVRVNLKAAIDGEGGRAGFPLQSSDIIYVPKTFIAKANKFVNQYIERLLLFRGVSVGFGYELKADN